MTPTFPTTLYHETLAPEGRRIPTAADMPKEKGWVDTPAKFDKDYEEPAPRAVPLDRVPADRPGYVPIAYPSTRYNQKTGEVCSVANAKEDGKLDAKIWKDTPNPVAEAKLEAAHAAEETGDDDTGLKAEFQSATAADVIARVETVNDKALLKKLRKFEVDHPKAARTTVLKAIDARLDELGK